MATKSVISAIIEYGGPQAAVTSSPVSQEGSEVCFATPGMREKEITSSRGASGLLPITFCGLGVVELEGTDAYKSKPRVQSAHDTDGGFGLESVLSIPRSARNVTNKLCHQWNEVSFLTIVVERIKARRRIL